jgi:mannose/fructose/N-acetylgalactosamine-specific phosphotransferase system component IID
MGYTLYSTGTATPEGLLNEADADLGKQVITWATSSVPGAGLGAVMSSSEMVYITGRAGASAATGGSISGRILYYVPTNGAYTA